MTAGLLHVFVGVWIGRPLTMASLFALFDVAIFPLCVAVFRLNTQLPALRFARKPIIRELIYPLQLILSIFCGSMLLNLALLLSGYPIAPLHFLSWVLAALTGILAILPLLRECKTPVRDFNWREGILLALNTLLLVTGYFFLPTLWQGLNLLLVQTTVVLLSVFTLSGRCVGLLLLIQYLIVVLATQQREGIFYTLTPDLIPAIWQAQWYLVFSAILANCLYQYRRWIQHQQARAASTNALLSRLSQTGASVVFRLTMPEEELHWQGSTEALFPDEEHTLSTLTLLDAHCDTPFLPRFHAWYSHQHGNSFTQEVILQTLHGKQMRGMVMFQRISNTAHLMGGVSLFVTASAAGSPAAR
ncbi:hypothetical protein PYW49_09165 [Enterobacter sp. 170198]|uniref:MASE1 domain-containing protein n=1 Tax=Enterobacter chinensis TaxID=3030997 RepID=A0ABU5D2Z7_9ENTR|nr:hypothetical protein [Enterobacter sp. 170198]MDY0417838.1 hypothetical protein [Enterobacter sp. 170198]